MGLENGQTRQINQNRQNFIEISKRAQKRKENQTDWVSRHSVAIQQADERMSQCSQTKITGHHVKDYVDQPRISNYYITVIPRGREQAKHKFSDKRETAKFH